MCQATFRLQLGRTLLPGRQRQLLPLSSNHVFSHVALCSQNEFTFFPQTAHTLMNSKPSSIQFLPSSNQAANQLRPPHMSLRIDGNSLFEPVESGETTGSRYMNIKNRRFLLLSMTFSSRYVISHIRSLIVTLLEIIQRQCLRYLSVYKTQQQHFLLCFPRLSLSESLTHVKSRK